MSRDFNFKRLQRATLVLADFERAILRLDDVLQQPKNEFIRDAAIQRFRFAFELAWKSIQVAARIEAQDCSSPRMAIAMAWRNAWIADEGMWLDMLEERNRTAHTYRESMAEEVFESLPRFLPLLRELHRKLTSRLREIESEPSKD